MILFLLGALNHFLRPLPHILVQSLPPADQTLRIQLHRLIRPSPHAFQHPTNPLVIWATVIQRNPEKILSNPEWIKPWTLPASHFQFRQQLLAPDREAHFILLHDLMFPIPFPVSSRVLCIFLSPVVAPSTT